MAAALHTSGFARTLSHTATNSNSSSSGDVSGDDTVPVHTDVHAASLLDMRVEGGGGTLSRGQCQLLCLARAILSLDHDRRHHHDGDDDDGDGDGDCGGVNAWHNIVLVDEATAALDSQAESLILAALSKAVRETGATLLAITHDPSTLVPHICDHVLTMADGVAVSLEKVTTT